MVILVTFKNEEDPIKIEGARVATIQNIDFSNTKGQLTAVRGRIWPKFKVIRDIVVILVTCKNEEDPLKNKDSRQILIFQTLKGRKLRSQRSDMVEIRTHPRCYGCPWYFQE